MYFFAQSQEFVTEFQITVPSTYKYSTRLSSFKTQYGSNFSEYNSEITDVNCKGVNKLLPGVTYTVKIFSVNSPYWDVEDYIGFVTKKGYFCAGAQGLSLVWQLHREQLEKLAIKDNFYTVLLASPETTESSLCTMRYKDTWRTWDFFWGKPCASCTFGVFNLICFSKN
jgi:hypothetical protein